MLNCTRLANIANIPKLANNVQTEIASWYLVEKPEHVTNARQGNRKLQNAMPRLEDGDLVIVKQDLSQPK